MSTHTALSLLGMVVTTMLSRSSAHSLSYNGLAQTPQMGWDTFNAYKMDYNETTIRTNAKLLVDLGFRDLGYDVVIFDDAMTELERGPDGKLEENRAKFPGGLKSLADDLHDMSLRFGVYSSAGRYTCAGYPGALGHETEDARWWAGLGADYLKYDNCFNEGQSGTPQISERRYATMSAALAATGRNITFSLCNWGDDKPWEWASTIANSARMSGDIRDSFDRPSNLCPCGPDEYYCQLPGLECSVMNILGKASYLTPKVHPGYWNDLDMLEVGNGGMTADEYRTHFSMWAAIKSPLIMGNKLDRMSPTDYGILINPAVLAISQDPDGHAIQRQVIVNQQQQQVWSGNLAGGDRVVAFLNAGDHPTTMHFSLVDIFGGLVNNADAARAWDLFDVWGADTVIPPTVAHRVLAGDAAIDGVDGGRWYWNATRQSFKDGVARGEKLLLGTPAGKVQAGGSISADVARHGVVMWRLRPAEEGNTAAAVLSGKEDGEVQLEL